MDHNFFIGISFIGGPEYLAKALDSLGKYRRNVLVLNCSDVLDGNHQLEDLRKDPSTAARIIRPEVRLSHTQCHNYFQHEAIRKNQPFYFVMHNDAEASEDVIETLMRNQGTFFVAGRKVAVQFTNYDALALYNTAAVKDVGPWDSYMFPSYYSDNDYYRRCTLAGYELIETHLPVKHEGSHIINKVSKWRKYLTRLNFDHWANMYVEKWGGHPGKETHLTPYGISVGKEPWDE